MLGCPESAISEEGQPMPPAVQALYWLSLMVTEGTHATESNRAASGRARARSTMREVIHD
jgi:hypothetical protein